MKHIITLFFTVLYFTVNAQTIFTQPITATKAHLGVFGTANLQIDDAGGDGEITKPLIVVEGFDSGLLGIENEFGENHIGTFIRGLEESESFDLRDFLTGGTEFLFGDQDFDIIYVNWDNGNDYLQRNAFALQEVINWVNEQKEIAGSTEPNVVLGQSMGGIIARYALADMEINNEIHDTSLYISHDAPHQGANIPLSIQYFAQHMVDQFVSTPLGDFNINVSGAGGAVTIEDIRTLLDAPGTKQLLANSINSSFTLDNTMHDAWMLDLQNKGYPQLTRNIAISNGNHCAEPQAFNPGDDLFVLNGNAKTGILTDFLIQFLGPLGTINDLSFIALAILFNEPALLIGVLPGNSKFNFNFKAKALPDVGNTIQIYKGKITFTKKILWFINLTVNITDRSFNNPPGVLSFDYYPGGFFNVFFNFQNTSVNNVFVNLNITADIADSFNFIPTPSALDIGNANVVLNDNDYFIKYNAENPPTAPKNTPFDNFTTSFQPNSNLNEEHISFNTRNGDWLASELDDNATNQDIFDCTFACTDSDVLIEDDIICSSTSYFFGNDIVISNITITQGQNLVNIFGNNSNTLSILPISTNAKGLLVFSFTIGNAECGEQTFTKQMWIGKPMDDLSMVSSGGFTLSTGNWYSLTATHQNYNSFIHSNLTYQWQIPYAQILFFNNNRTVSVQPTQLGTYPYKLKTENICGCSNWITRFFEVLSTPGRGDLYISPAGN